MYLAALTVCRDAATAGTATAAEVRQLLGDRLGEARPPEHHRIRQEGEDELTIVCFLAGSGAGTEAQVSQITDLVRSALANLPGWVLDTRQTPIN